MVVVLVRWSFGALAHRLLICLLQQALLHKLFGGGGVRMAMRLRPAIVSIVGPKWSNDLFVTLLFLDIYIFLLQIINR
jgi:hypothetical protein